MSIALTCGCGATYSLKDEMAGRQLKCPKCGAVMTVGPSSASLPPGEAGDPAFARDRFLLRQKVMTINEKYYVWDTEGKTILFVERPAHLLRNVGAMLAGIAVILVGILLAVGIGFGLADVVGNETVGVVGGVLFGIVALFGGVLVIIWLQAKRHITFYRDDTKQERILEILQDQKFAVINATFTVLDPRGELIARFHKNYLYNLIRKRWYCISADGTPLFTAKEDSILLSILRRFLGTLYGLLRTNYIFVPGEGDSEEIIGEFNRKFTLLDRYVLDLSADAQRTLDRRLGVAMGVLLDTGERR